MCNYRIPCDSSVYVFLRCCLTIGRIKPDKHRTNKFLCQLLTRFDGLNGYLQYGSERVSTGSLVTPEKEKATK